MDGWVIIISELIDGKQRVTTKKPQITIRKQTF